MTNGLMTTAFDWTVGSANRLSGRRPNGLPLRRAIHRRSVPLVAPCLAPAAVAIEHRRHAVNSVRARK